MILPKFRIIAFPLLSLALTVSCTKTAPDQRKENREDIPLTKSQVDFLHKGNDFCFHLMQADGMVKDASSVFSPLSVQLSLGMLQTATSGSSQKEIIDALGFIGNGDDVNDYYRYLTDQLVNADKKTTLALANAVIYNEDFAREIVPSFSKDIQQYYQSFLGKTSFKKPASSFFDGLNAWCEKQTNGVIHQVADSKSAFDADAFAFLYNLMSFKSEWVKPFDSKFTKYDRFYLLDGEDKTVDMMQSFSSFRYYEDDHLQALSMDFGNEAYRFIALLPKENCDWETFIPSLNDAYFNDVLAKSNPEMVYVHFPKYTISSTLSLEKPLMDLGIKSVFSPGSADLSPMAKPSSGLYVDRLQQRAVFQIDEKGSEASAQTEVKITAPTAPSDEERQSAKVFYANHPFVFAIYETSTKAIILLGQFCG